MTCLNSPNYNSTEVCFVNEGSGRSEQDEIVCLPLFELACVLVRLDYITSGIVNADDSIM